MFKCFCLFRVFDVYGFLGFSFFFLFFCGLWLQQVRRGNVPDPLSETHLTHKVRDDNYGITVTEHIESGARIENMIFHLQTLSDEQIASFDCTIVVCMFNARANQRQLDCSEMSGMSSLVITLCALLGKHKRAAIIMGGSAALWQFSEEWDAMVQKNVAISRVSGIMTIDGTRYFEEMRQIPNGWHFGKTEHNLSRMRDMIEDTRNALYAAYPQGTYARPIPLSVDDATALGLNVDPAGAVALPLQGGVPQTPTTSVSAAYAAAAKQSFRTRPLGVAPILPWGSEIIRASWPPPRPTPIDRVQTAPQPVLVPGAFKAGLQAEPPATVLPTTEQTTTVLPATEQSPTVLPATVQPATKRGPEHFAIGSDTDSAGAVSTASLPYMPADLTEWELPDVTPAAPTTQPSLLQGGLAAAPKTPIVPPKKPPPPLCPERVVRPAGKKPPPPLCPEPVVRPARKRPPPTLDERPERPAEKRATIKSPPLWIDQVPSAKRKAPPPTLEESGPPAKRPPITPWTATHTVPSLQPRGPLPPTAVPTTQQLKAMLKPPPPPPKVTTAVVPWGYTNVLDQAPMTPQVAPLSPPPVRALQDAALAVDTAWADIENNVEYVAPASWYARPSFSSATTAAPATPTEMPPLPPETAEAAPALILYTEDMRQTLPGALQGDEEPPQSGELVTEVEKDYPDVRMSKSSRPIPEDRRVEKFCLLCHQVRNPTIRNFCPYCRVQDTLIPMRHILVPAIIATPLDFDGKKAFTNDLNWNMTREIFRLTLENRNGGVKIEPEDEPPIPRRRVGIDPLTHELAFGDLENVKSSYSALQLQTPALSSGAIRPVTTPLTSVIATQTDTLRDDMSLIVDDDDYEIDDDAFLPPIDHTWNTNPFTAQAVGTSSYRSLDDGMAVADDDDVDYGDAASASDDNQPTLATAARATQATTDGSDDDATIYASATSQRSALQGVASNVPTIPSTIPAYSGATPLASGISPPTTGTVTRTHELSELPSTTPGDSTLLGPGGEVSGLQGPLPQYMLPPTTTSGTLQGATQIDDLMLPAEAIDELMSVASSSAIVAPPRAKRTRRVEPVGLPDKAAEEAADILELEAEIPLGIRFLTIQGMRGAGCTAASEGIVEFLLEAGVPVVNIDVNSFIEASSQGCTICTTLELDFTGVCGNWPLRCPDGPDAVNKGSLYAHIIDRAKVLAASATYQVNGYQGLIVLLGRHTTGLNALSHVISKRKQWWTFYLQPPNSAPCAVRHLRSINQWEHDDLIAALPDDDVTPLEVTQLAETLLAPHMMKSCYALRREYEHYARIDTTYEGLADWVIDISKIGTTDIVTTILHRMILASDDNHEQWDLPPPAVPATQAPSASARTAEGTPTADPIEVAPVTELLPERPGLTSRREVETRDAAAASSASPTQPPGWVSSDVRVTRPAAPARRERASLRPNNLQAPWSEPNYVHPRTITATIPRPGETITRNMPRGIVNCQRGSGKNYRGVFHDNDTWNGWSRRLNTLLRHNTTFPVNEQGFAFAEDIVFALENDSRRGPNPDIADLMFVVKTQEKLRFQASSLKGTGATRDFMIRNVQGHSGNISRQVTLDKAHTRVTNRDEIQLLVHHTATSKLYQMLGTDESLGLIPGGPPDNGNRELRNTTFCSTKLASLKGELPDRFRRRGTNCAVHLDVDLLFENNIRLYRSAAGVILIPDLVDVKYIKRVTLITPPAFTLYSRPKHGELNYAHGEDLHCLDCGTIHRRGCWRCFNCWESITWAGVADRQAFILDSSERQRELRIYYELTPRQFDTICKTPGSAINTLPTVRNARPDDEEETEMYPPLAPWVKPFPTSRNDNA